MSTPQSNTPTPAQVSTETPNSQSTQPTEVSDVIETMDDVASESDVVKSEPVSTKKKFKLVVDGKEFEEEIDFSDEKSLTEHLQLAKAAKKRMQEKAQLEKDLVKFLDLLRTNPKKVLSDPDLGIDLKEFAASIIEEEIANSQKSPEVLAKEKAEQELQALREQYEREQNERKTQEYQRLVDQKYEYYDHQINAALEKSSLPKNPYIIDKMTNYMILGLSNGIDVKPEDVVALVEEEVKNDLHSMFQVMPEDIIEKFIGQDVLNKVRKKRIAQVKKTPVNPLASVVETPKEIKQEIAKPKKSIRDFLND